MRLSRKSLLLILSALWLMLTLQAGVAAALEKEIGLDLRLPGFLTMLSLFEMDNQPHGFLWLTRR